MTLTDDNLSEQKEPEGFDPKKLNLTLVFAGILAILLMWYLSAKLF